MGIFGIWWGLFLKLGEGSCGLLYPTKWIKSLSQVQMGWGKLGNECCVYLFKTKQLNHNACSAFSIEV